MSKHETPQPGSVATATRNGRRTLLVELQALVEPSYGEYPKRYGQGIDSSRIPMLVAVLARYSELSLTGYDIFINAVGGVHISDCASDAALLAALISAYYKKPIDSKTLILGEIGLLGELRPISTLEERIAEAALRGFERALVPTLAQQPAKDTASMSIVGLARVEDLVQMLI